MLDHARIANSPQIFSQAGKRKTFQPMSISGISMSVLGILGKSNYVMYFDYKQRCTNNISAIEGASNKRIISSDRISEYNRACNGLT